MDITSEEFRKNFERIFGAGPGEDIDGLLRAEKADRPALYKSGQGPTPSVEGGEEQ